MKILIAAIHPPASSARYMAWAFQRLGHEVLSVGPPIGGNVWNLKIDSKYNWIPNISAKVELIGHALDLTDGWDELEKLFRPDLVLTVDSHFTVRMGRNDIPHVLFGVDNHLNEYRIDDVQWDHMFLAHSTGFRMGEEKVHWLPCAYDPVHFTPSPIAWEDREFDVCLVGWISPRRAEVAMALIDAGYKVKVVTGLLYEEFAAAYHNARISLCVSVAGALAQRIFETSALHCTLLSDTCADFERVGFRPWEHYVPFDTAQDAVLMTKKILAEPKLSLEIADRALAWVQPHTWDARGEYILNSVFKP
jgi:hypothetical protein